jgi:hypothetical protein
MKVLVFSPGHAIWSWAFPAALAAESLRQRGHDVLYVHCDSEYGKGCMAQASMRVPWKSSPEEKARICAGCRANAKMLVGRLDLPEAPFSSFITPEDRARARGIVESATPENYGSIELEGVPIGRLAMYELIIQNMKRSLRFEDREWENYRDILDNAARAVLGYSRACDCFRPDVCLIEHTAYSYNRACQLVAEKRGIPAYYMNESSQNVAHSSELLVIAKGDPLIFYRNTINAWAKSAGIPVSAREAEEVTDHFLALIQAKGRVYSAAKKVEGPGIRERFGIRPDQKVLLATTSSYDEMFAVEVVGNFAWDTRSDVFPMQIDWIKAVLEYVRGRPELFLVLRIHPREFMSQKNGGLSEHAQSLMKELQNLPPNAAVNWPSDKISMYDLIDETDVGLNAWSTAGSELAFFGIPVVVYCGHLLLYPETLNYSAKSREEYFRLIDRALADGWDFERVRTLYRWYAAHQLRVAVNVSDSFPSNVLRKRTLFERAYFKIRRKFNPLYDNLYRVKRRAKRLAAAEQIERLLQSGGATFLDLTSDARGTTGQVDSSTRDAESHVILEQLSRLYRAMYGEKNATPRPGSLQARLKAAIES